MSNKTYYLFGGKAVRMYHNYTRLDIFINELFDNSVEFALYEHNNNDDPDDLLEAYDGWNGYARITEDEYELLKAKQNNEY